MTKAIVIGDGPSGLSAALFLAKNGIDTTVFGLNKSNVHYALLHNYLGIPEMDGSDFAAIARSQVTRFGAVIVASLVTNIATAPGGFTVFTDDGQEHEVDFVIIAEGKAIKLAVALDLKRTETGVVVDRHGRTAVSGLYVVGRATNRTRSQTIISAGEGAAAALDILSIVHGKDFSDFNERPKAG